MKLRLISISLVSALLATAHCNSTCADNASATTTELDKKVDAVVADNFKKLGDLPKPGPVFPWSSRATPVFPDAWPPVKGMKLASYGFCWAENSPHSEHQSSPFLIVRVDPTKSNALSTESVKFNPKDFGTLGFGPITKAELDRYLADKQTVVQLFTDVSQGKKEPTAADLAVVKRYYKSWASNNSVINARLAPYQKNFFAWLQEKP